MLQYIRENTRSVGASIIIGLMVLSMALFGVDALFAPENTTGVAGRVNGKDISQSELNNEIQRQRQQWQSRMGANSEFLSDDVLQPAAMQQLVARELVRQAADNAGIKFSSDSADAQIVQNPSFQIDGKFDADRYRITLGSAGLTPQMYRNMVLSDMAVQQYALSVSATSIADPAAVDALALLINQTRSFDYTLINWASQVVSVEPTDEQIQQFYDTNGDRFMSAESVDIEYLLIDRSSLSQDFEVTEEMLLERYQAFSEGYAGVVERRVSHILVESNDAATIAAITEGLAAGESFADLASRYSDDFGSSEQGGDLGFTDGTLFAEEFEAAVASLEVGEVSQPVSTDFGTHIIMVTEISEPKAPALADVRGQLVEELKQEQSEGEYIDLIASVEDAVYQSSDLLTAAEQIGLKANAISKMSRAGAAYPLDQSVVINEAFNEDLIAEGVPSPIIELEDGSAVVVRIADYHPSVLRAFEEVSEEAADLVVAKLAKEAAMTSAVEMADAQAALSQSAVDIKRFDTTMPRPLLQAIFELAPVKGQYQTVALPSGDAVVVKIVEIGQGATSAEELSALKAMFSGPDATNEFGAAQGWLRDKAEVEAF